MRWSAETLELMRLALAEDLGSAGDITSDLLTGDDAAVTARIVPREAGVICGLSLLPALIRTFTEICNAHVRAAACNREGTRVQDGAPVAPGDEVARLQGPQRDVLALERTLLNFLGRMSGVATLTRHYVDAARRGNPQIEVLDTRKTIPGWRELDKYAVRCGGGANHRFGLYDAILIKDNHFAGVPVERLGAHLNDLLYRRPAEARFVEVEVDDLEQFAAVCTVPGIDVVLLDNFSFPDLRRAVGLRDERGLRGRLSLEASGGVTLDTIANTAASGVDRISVGALTHSAPSLDVGLDL